MNNEISIRKRYQNSKNVKRKSVSGHKFATFTVYQNLTIRAFSNHRLLMMYLLRYVDNYPIFKRTDENDTLWQGVIYGPHETSGDPTPIQRNIYSRSTSDGANESTDHLFVDSVD
ncbi:hypothetical protein [Halpernia sp. GG3]